jgi:lipopolysaccharide transport system permease protein
MSIPVTVIRPQSKWYLINIKELWHYRELFYIFSWRDLKVRYKQTFLGALWALFQPLTSMFVFTIFFGNFAKIPSANLPYSLFVLIGLVFWTYFTGIVSNASNSLIDNEHIIKKVYFPRIILPFSKLGTGLVDFVIMFILLLIVSLINGKYPLLISLIIIPLALIISSVGASGLGLFLAAFNVKYRDVRYILPFFIQMLIFISPVIYPVSIMRPEFSFLMSLNPMTGVIAAVRVAFGGYAENMWSLLAISAVSSALLLFIGLYYFRLTEKYFADAL